MIPYTGHLCILISRLLIQTLQSSLIEAILQISELSLIFLDMFYGNVLGQVVPAFRINI